MPNLLKGARRFCCVAAVSTASFQAGQAADIYVPTGETRTTSQIINDPGEFVTIAPMGAIRTIGGNQHAVLMLLVDQTTINLGAISTVGSGSYGIIAHSNGLSASGATLINNGTIRTTGIGSGGILSQYIANSQIINSGTVETIGRGLDVFEAPNSMIHNAGKGSVKTNSNGAIGMRTRQSTSTTLVNDGDVATFGLNSHGISVHDSALAMVINNGAIETKATFSDGIAIRSSRGGINAPNANGSSVTNNGLINIETSIRDAVGGSYGIAAYESSDISVTNNGTIRNSAREGVGLYIFQIAGGSVVNSSGAEIATSGATSAAGSGSHGIAILDSSLTGTVLNAGRIITTGAQAHGIAVVESAPTTVENSGSIVVSGNGSHGVFFARASGAAGPNILLNAGAITASDGDAVRDEAGSIWITSSGQIVGNINAGGDDDRVTLAASSSTAGRILMEAGSDALVMQGPANITEVTLFDGGDDHLAMDGSIDRLSFKGGTRTQDAALIRNWEQIALDEGAALTLSGNELLVGSGGETENLQLGLTIGAGTRLAVADTAFSITGDVINAGTISLQNDRIGDTLAVTADPSVSAASGRYVGQGGQLLIDTFLSDSTSPTDRLILAGGSASGHTPLEIRNAGGAGALTAGNGIEVVQAVNSATSQTGAFTLSGPVTAGPYEYTLFHGSVDASNTNSWYLRSTLDCSLAPNAKVCPMPSTTSVPNYRQEVSLYSVLPRMATLYGRTLLDTLHQRVGEEEHLRGRGDSQRASRFNGAWARVIGQFGKREGGETGIYGSEGARFDYRTFALQMGMDVYRRETGTGHRDHAGVYGAIGHMSGNVWHPPAYGRAGVTRLDGYTVGGYWTHFGPSGWYVDAVAQATRYDARATSTRAGYSLDTQGWGLAGSLESGMPFRFDAGWVIEPQTQLVYQNISLDGADDRSARFDWHDTSSLTGRLGLRVAKTWQQDDEGSEQPLLTTIWTRVDLWQEFMGESALTASSTDGAVPFHDNIRGTWAELNIGVTSQLTRTASLYGNVGVKIGLEGESQMYEGRIGLRVNW